MRSIKQMRNNSQQLAKTPSKVSGAAFSTSRKTQQGRAAMLIHSESSDQNVGDQTSKSQRNLQSDSGNFSTGPSSKMNSDNTPSEPNPLKYSSVSTKLFKNSPTRTISSRARQLKKPQKICALNHSQVMTNRYLGVLKSKLPVFDMEDAKIIR